MKNYQLLRNLIQVMFTLIVLNIGWRFYSFVKFCETAGATPYVERPPGVEAFLPISSLMSLKYTFDAGYINRIHPAGLVIFVAILIIAILFKKSFCSWICPIGFLSEASWRVGERLFGKNLKIPKILDYILRSIKYLILGFFVWVIFFAMDVNAMRSFIYSPYNRIADVKMLMYWIEISQTEVIVVSILILLSLVFKNFWCRYLCPYGALLGFTSILSPFKVTRDPESCTNCKNCSRVCPAYIPVHTKKRVHSDECMACMACVDACHVDSALKFKLIGKKFALSGYHLAAAVVITYFAFVAAGKVTGNWKNDITVHEYMMRVQDISDPVYDHNRGKGLY